MSQTVSLGVANGAASFLRSHPVIATQLPPPGQTWSREDAPDVVAERLSKLQSTGIVTVAVPHGAPSEYDAHLYRTREGAYQFAQTNVNAPPTLDCGHTGIRNLGGGEYTCADDGCEIRVGRNAAREVLGR